ncbi:hypothetical protein SDC9_54637 [bioreactor metagenome]|uniref:Uncharacterized protein n=1 Tax=bioreactor metagenome TaxID=1076179 RepID=A0A644WWM5_9ZZZZ
MRVDLHLQGTVLHRLFLPPEVVLLKEGPDHMVVEVVEDVPVLLRAFSLKVSVGNLGELVHHIGKELAFLPVGSVGKVESQKQSHHRKSDGVVHECGGEGVELHLVHAQAVFPPVLVRFGLEELHILLRIGEGEGGVCKQEFS